MHVAGILRDRMVFNMSIEEWDAVINVHLRGAFCVNKPACVLMRAQRRAAASSTFRPSRPLATLARQYSAAKAGILGLTRTVSRYGEVRVRANDLAWC